MTITYDPKHPKYLDEADVREEMTRVYDLCHGCRLCFKFCTSFPSLFELIDRFDDQDAGRLTPAEQDRVVDECFQCKLCYVNCPYIPELHEWALDFPRLMLRAEAMRYATGQKPIRQRLTTQAMARTDLLGTLSTAPVVSTITHKMIGAPEGSLVRKAVAKLSGVSSVRLLPPYAKQRFSTWFKKRTAVLATQRRGAVTVFPTCLVEYQATQIGKDLVRVYERNGIACSLTDAGCCGAPWLHAGDIAHFTKIAEQNVKTLAAEVRRGTEIVVPQPTCGYVLKKDYVDYVGGPDAELVAANTYDAAEYLMKVHKTEGCELDTNFTGTIPETVTYHAACHLRAQNIGFKSRDLMKLTGAKVTLVQQCSGIDGMWGLRAENEQISIPIAKKLADQIEKAGGGQPGNVVAGDCNLANTAIAEQTGSAAIHPISIIARAYGIPEPDR
jgi:glycerol-3-phosphate dehydrogenase subunit C